MVTPNPFSGRSNQYSGLSTDEKPMDVPNSSSFYEMDTKTLFLFDAENSQWLEQFTFE